MENERKISKLSKFLIGTCIVAGLASEAIGAKFFYDNWSSKLSPESKTIREEYLDRRESVEKLYEQLNHGDLYKKSYKMVASPTNTQIEDYASAIGNYNSISRAIREDPLLMNTLEAEDKRAPYVIFGFFLTLIPLAVASVCGLSELHYSIRRVKLKILIENKIEGR